MSNQDDSSSDGNQTQGQAAEAAAIAGPDAGFESEVTVHTTDSAGDQEQVSAEGQPWLPLFPFESPYGQQVTGINEFIETLSENGFYAVEGACGTGKTLIGLVGGTYAMQSETLSRPGSDAATAIPEYDRLVAVTPVKQQLKQFIEEVRTINRNLPDSGAFNEVSGIVLRGASDMMAYSNADEFELGAELARALEATGDDGVGGSSLRDRISELRETTRKLIQAGSPVELDWEVTEPSVCVADDCRHLSAGQATSTCPFHTNNPNEEDPPWTDIVRTDRVLELAEEMDGERLTVNGAETPYPSRFPAYSDVTAHDRAAGMADLQTPFDPFYAKGIAGLFNVSFSDGEARVLDRDALVATSAADGSCPHVVMGELAGKADVVIGNYNHLFDPETRQLTAGKADLFGEETALVVDEAHRVEDRVRDLLSDDVSPYGLRRAYNDIIGALEFINRDTSKGDTSAQMEAQATAREVLQTAGGNHSFSTDSLERAADFITWAIDQLDGIVTEYLTDEYRNWEAAIGNGKPSQDSIELDEPDAPRKPDTLREQITDSKWNLDYFTRFGDVCVATAQIHEEVEISDRETVCGNVGQLFRRWNADTGVETYREVVLEHSPHQNPPAYLPDWCSHITARFHLYTTLPGDRVATMYDENGGGITMSATLEPLDEYKETAGLEPLTTTNEDEHAGVVPSDCLVQPSSFEDRTVRTNTYELAFPESNRASWVVDTPKFTSRKRGKPIQDWEDMTPVRQQYARSLADIASSFGNHLIAMPNYREAQWAGKWLEAQTSKPIYIDESSSSDATTTMLEEFFADDHAVAVTSSLGTVTEGVDYDGSKLHCMTVVGVPYRNIATGRSQAIIEAYDRQVGDESQSGFETAIAIPAVRKARQAIGRVLRAPEEEGVRLFLDGRYAKQGRYAVGQHLSPQEYSEFDSIDPDLLDRGLSQFWDGRLSADAETASERDGSDETRLSSVGQESDNPDNQETKSNTTASSSSGNDDTSKIYFGKEASLSGWIEVPTTATRREIIPIAREHADPDQDIETTKLNFSSGLDMNGWTDVDAGVVDSQIVPRVREIRE